MKFSYRERIVAVGVNIPQRYRDVVFDGLRARVCPLLQIQMESLRNSGDFSTYGFNKIFNSFKNVSFNLFGVTSYTKDGTISKRN